MEEKGLSSNLSSEWISLKSTETHKVIEKITLAETLLVCTKTTMNTRRKEAVKFQLAGSRKDKTTTMLPTVFHEKGRMTQRVEGTVQEVKPCSALRYLHIPSHLGRSPQFYHCLIWFPVPVRAFLIQPSLQPSQDPTLLHLFIFSLSKSHLLPTLKSFWECLIIKAIPSFNFVIFSWRSFAVAYSEQKKPIKRDEELGSGGQILPFTYW